MTSAMSGFNCPACAPTGLASRVIAVPGSDSRIAWIAGVVTSTSPRLSRRTARMRRAARQRSSITGHLRGDLVARGEAERQDAIDRRGRAEVALQRQDDCPPAD